MKRKKKTRKLSIWLTFQMILFALMIIIFTTAVGTGLLAFQQTIRMTEFGSSFVQGTAGYVDPDRITCYLDKPEKDAYYNEITDYLTLICDNSPLDNLYVFIPFEDHITYIWDSYDPSYTALLGESDPYTSEAQKNAITEVLSSKEKRLTVTDRGGKTFMAFYCPILDRTGKPVAIAGGDLLSNVILQSFRVTFITLSEVIVIVAVIFLILFYFNTNRRIMSPLRKLRKATEELSDNVQHDQRGKPITIDIHTRDELEALADSLMAMNRDLGDYINQLEKVTMEKEKIHTELGVAARIQADMLPGKFPPFADRRDFAIFASMDPAREVGGDFYDFFFLDETHLGLVIADVSDKGVPASLFMVVSKTLLKQRAAAGGTPAQILADVNNQLCEDNDENLFVTVWLAVIDLSTGEGIEANAGHEYPFLRRKGGEFSLVQDPHGLPLGALPGSRFHDMNFTLHPGDCLFTYTDGAPEANNPAKEQFGTGRLKEALNRVTSNDPKEMIDSCTAAIAEFVQDAEQFDDTTMLAFSFFGPEGMPEDLYQIIYKKKS